MKLQVTNNFNKLAYVYPPDLKSSHRHRLANRIFRNIDFQKLDQDVCECCGRYVGEQSPEGAFSYDPLKEFQYLGPGVPLFFTFVQNNICFLFLLVLIIALQAIIQNTSKKDCFEGSCGQQDIINKLSISQKILDGGSLTVQVIMVTVFTVVWVFLNQLFVYRCRVVEVTADKNKATPSDFAIFLLNLPDFTQKKDIEHMLHLKRKIIQTRLSLQKLDSQTEKFLREVQNFKVEKIIMPHKISKFIKQQKQQQNLFKEYIKRGDPSGFSKRNTQYSQQCVNVAIVVFQKELTKDLFLKQFSLCSEIGSFLCNWGYEESDMKVRDRNITVVRACQPDDIIWQNLEKSNKSIYINKMITFGGGVIVLIIGGLVQFLLALWELNNLNTQLSKFILVLSTVLVTFTNYLISRFLLWVTNKEGNLTRSKYNASLNIKICIFQFFNSGIFYTLSNLLATLATEQNFQLNTQSEFASKITVFMIINAFSEPFQNLILDYTEFPKSIIRYLQRKNLVNYSQKQSNELYEYSDCAIPFKYAYVIKTIWLTCFFATFVPIVVIFSFVGLIIYYFSFKISFRHWYKITDVRSNEANLRALRLSFFAPLMLNIGQILVFIYVSNIFSQLSIFENIIIYSSLILSIVYSIFPWYEINKQIITLQNRSNQIYKDVKFQFELEYDNHLISPSEQPIQQKNEKYFLLSQARQFSKKQKIDVVPYIKMIATTHKALSTEIMPSGRNLLMGRI